MKIYVVSGSSGDYGDRSDWMVKAFTDPNMAAAFCRECQEFVDKIGELAQERGWDIMRWLEEIEKRGGPDSHLHTFDGSAYYGYAPIELVEE